MTGGILVTGAGGFVGEHLMPALRDAYPDDRIFGSGPLDIVDVEEVRAIFAAHMPAICIHLAAIAAPAAAQAGPAQAWAVNFQGTLNIARAILAGAPACRLIFVSSAECYGASFKSGLALDETAPLAPMNTYAATKAAAEMALSAMAAEGLRVLRLRPFNHTGPGQREDFVVPAFAGQIARIEAGLAPPEISVGALNPERDFLDVRDVCAAYVSATRNFDALPNNHIVNIASGQATRIGAILDMLLAEAKCPITIRQDPSRLRPVEIARAAGNPGRAGKLLGFTPRYDLADTLRSVLDAARQHVNK